MVQLVCRYIEDMPAKYIYEPWLAPLEVQKKAKCVVGVDYPEPMVGFCRLNQVDP
jgi:deoxyribodipyrimidine photolyase